MSRRPIKTLSPLLPSAVREVEEKAKADAAYAAKIRAVAEQELEDAEVASELRKLDEKWNYKIHMCESCLYIRYPCDGCLTPEEDRQRANERTDAIHEIRTKHARLRAVQ